MSFFFILVFGTLITLAWRRISALERQITSLSSDLDSLRYNASDRRPAVMPTQGAQVAQDAVPADEPAGYEPEPEDDPSRAQVPVTPDIIAGTAPAQPLAAVPAPPRSIAAAAEPGAAGGHEDALDAEPPTGFSFDFEDIFGRRLPIWGGGFALAIAGIFLVRFSIEAGLLTPAVRVAMSFVFGLALLAGAETAYRFDARLADPRVRQALAGAGLATLYGAFYLAGTSYGLIGAGAAFGGLAAVTISAIALSFRYGLPSAVIGLVGGFAAPLLVNSDSSNVPLLAFYLALITGGLTWSGQAQGRSWLSYAALAAGLGWGVLMMIAGVPSDSDLAALGVYLVVLGAVLPAFLHAKGGLSVLHLVAGGLATLQMAVLVTNAGFAPLIWGLYLLIAAALAGLGWRFEALRLGTLVAAGLGMWLLVMWPEPDARFFALVAAGQVAIFAGVPLAYQLRARAKLLDLAQLAGVSLVMGVAIYARYGAWTADDSEPLLAAVLASLAALPAAAFALLWRRWEEARTREALVVIAPAALLGFAALLLVTPAWMAPIMALVVSAPLLWCEARRDAPALQSAAWAGAAVTLLSLIVTPGYAQEFMQLGDVAEPVETARALARWAASAAPFAALVLLARNVPSRRVGEAIAVALTYGVIAQALPSTVLAWIAAIAAAGLFVTQRARAAAWITALAIAAAWTLVLLAGWVTAGLLAVVGDPFMATSAISPVDLAMRMAPLAAALAVLLWQGQDERRDVRAAVLVGLGAIGGIAVHSLYKQVFGITSLFQFEHYAMGERSIWDAALVAAAYGAGQVLPHSLRRPVGLGLIAAALAHFGWFTLILHNPLLSVQHVGPTPIANWLSLAYLTALCGLWLGREQWEAMPSGAKTAIDAIMMALISLLAFSLLRQAFAGSVLTVRGVDQTESLLISLLGIVLALGFLWWGSWRAARSWRIGSLVLMLAAVIKVFLIDAAGLEGLLRIASFMALGFSLIGIGWVYSRQLSLRPQTQ